jgi:hypothetical protein
VPGSTRCCCGPGTELGPAGQRRSRGLRRRGGPPRATPR